jgi:hypothetical protein
MATKGSAAGFAAKRPDHLHAKGGDGHQKVSSKFVMKEQSE